MSPSHSHSPHPNLPLGGEGTLRETRSTRPYCGAGCECCTRTARFADLFNVLACPLHDCTY